MEKDSIFCKTKRLEKYNSSAKLHYKFFLLTTDENNKEIKQAYFSESLYKKNATLLMILNEEKWCYWAVRKLSALSRNIFSKHHEGFYYLNLILI